MKISKLIFAKSFTTATSSAKTQGQGGHREDLTLVQVAHLLPLTPESADSA